MTTAEQWGTNGGSFFVIIIIIVVIDFKSCSLFEMDDGNLWQPRLQKIHF